MPSPSYNAPAFRIGLKLVSLLSRAREPLGVSEISRALGTNKNMAFRLLATLQAEGWATAEEPGPKYRLTLLPFAVTSAVAARLDIREAARQPLQELWDVIGESVYVGILYDDQVLYLDHRDGTGPVRIAGQVGGRYPLHCTAPGKVLLAHAPASVLARLLAAGLTRYTDSTLTTATALRAELRVIRQHGFAMDREEYSRGLLCYAAPVYGAAGEVAGCLGVSVTTLGFTPERLVSEVGPRVVAAAAETSRRLGHQRAPGHVEEAS